MASVVIPQTGVGHSAIDIEERLHEPVGQQTRRQIAATIWIERRPEPLPAETRVLVVAHGQAVSGGAASRVGHAWRQPAATWKVTAERDSF